MKKLIKHKPTKAQVDHAKRTMEQNERDIGDLDIDSSEDKRLNRFQR